MRGTVRTYAGRARSAAGRIAPAVLLLTLFACDANPYDPAQEPRVSVTVSATPISVNWSPEGAQLLRIYEGNQAGDGYGPTLMWSVVATGTNTLHSGVLYGVLPGSGVTLDFAPRQLVSGTTYTAQVRREDPKGSGDGFTNTRNNYVGTATFTVP